MNDRPRKPGGPGKRSNPRPGGGKPFTKGGGKSGGRPDGEGARARAGTETGERIAKRLARAGVSSRRDAEALIAAGRVAVNGRVLSSPAFNVGGADVITIDGQPIPAIERTRLFLFHKPAGLVTTNRDPEGRRTVFDVLPEGLPRLVTVGRLDINTEGLLLLTNDGGLARVLELPSTGWLRRYRVRVHGRVDEQALVGLKDGVAVDGVFYGSVEASLDREQGSNAWLTIGLREGKNREVKNILGALGLDVTRLIRVSYGPFQLGELPEGAVHELKGRTLRDQLGERLIDEAGANFEAPVVSAFSNKPVAGASPRAGDRRDAPSRPARAEPGEGGLIKNRKRERESRREDALDRLQTSPGRRDAPGGFGGKPKFAGKPAPGPRQKGREDRGEPAPVRSRTTNVWMAPGARPRRGKQDEPESPPRRDDSPRRDDRPRGEDRPRNAGPGKREREAFGHRGNERRSARPQRAEDAADAPRGRGDRPFRERTGASPGERPARAVGAEDRSARKPRSFAGRPKGEGPRGAEDADGARARKPFRPFKDQAAGSPGGKPRDEPRKPAGAGSRKGPGEGFRKGSGKGPGGGPRKGPPKGPPRGRGGV